MRHRRANVFLVLSRRIPAGECCLAPRIVNSDISCFSLGRSVSPLPSRKTCGSYGRDAQDPYAVHSYTPPRGGAESTPRSCGQDRPWNMFGTSPDLLIQTSRAEGPFMDLNEENLGILHPHVQGREPLSEVDEWLQRKKCSGKAVPKGDSVNIGPVPKSEHREEISHAPKAHIADTSKLIQQYTPDATGRSGPAHRQIDAHNNPRTRSTTEDEEDASEVRKKF